MRPYLSPMTLLVYYKPRTTMVGELNLKVVICFVTLYLFGTPACSFLMGDSIAAKMSNNSDTIPELAEPPLNIGSFNIQIFGKTKNSNQDVVRILVQILSRYDIVQVLEIRDADQTEFESLRQSLNAYVKSQGGTYTYDKVESARLGRSTSKEQYGFLYRTDLVTMVDTYQYPDTHDIFEREPYGVRFRSPKSVVDDFGLIATHIQPSNALQEIDNLTMVYEAFKKHWRLENIIVAGDFNADCNYISVGELHDTSFRQDPRFYWAIPDNMDTSVQDGQCGYDKCVVAGDDLIKAVVPGSAKTYRFNEDMKLSDRLASQVSDHFPIEISLAGKPFSQIQSGIDSSISFTVKDNHQVSNVNNIRAMYRSQSCLPRTYTVEVEKVGTHMHHVDVTFNSNNMTSLMAELVDISKACAGTLSTKLLAMVNAYLKSDYLGNVPNVYGVIFSNMNHTYKTVITCYLATPYVCKVEVFLQVSG